MKRKEFLQTAAPAVMIPGLISGFGMKAFASNNFLKKLARRAAANGRVFVIIELNGGNDGLNMVIPVDQYSNLSNARNNILIPGSECIFIAIMFVDMIMTY